MVVNLGDVSAIPSLGFLNLLTVTFVLVGSRSTASYAPGPGACL